MYGVCVSKSVKPPRLAKRLKKRAGALRSLRSSWHAGARYRTVQSIRSLVGWSEPLRAPCGIPGKLSGLVRGNASNQ